MEDMNRFAPVDFLAFEDDGEKYFSVQIIVGEAGLEAAENLFEKYDNYPNGYGWEGLVTYFLTKEASGILEVAEFDCEAGMFSMNVDSEENMLKAAAMLQTLILDEAKLTRYLAELPDEFKDA